MSSKHLIDPELLSVLDMFPPFPLSSDILPGLRQMLNEIAAATPVAEASDVDVDERRIAASAEHEIGVLVYTPHGRSSARPALLHIHGGGYIVGSAKMSQAANQLTASAADCVVVSVDYRLAPETPHPGPVEDCYAALKWLHDNAGALGVDPTRLAVAGESAGGGLAAALALLARDRGEIPLIHQHLTYPMIDDRTCTAEPHPYAGEFVWTASYNHFGWSSLLGGSPGRKDVSPYAAAARAENLAGLPSTYIAVGALDLFVEENIEYARRLVRAGVPTELHVYPGTFHGFENATEARVTKAAQHSSVTALRRALHPD